MKKEKKEWLISMLCESAHRRVSGAGAAAPRQPHPCLLVSIRYIKLIVENICTV